MQESNSIVTLKGETLVTRVSSEQPKEDKQVVVTIPAVVHQQVSQEVERLGMSMSSFIRLLIAQYFDSVQFGRKREVGS